MNVFHGLACVFSGQAVRSGFKHSFVDLRVIERHTNEQIDVRGKNVRRLWKKCRARNELRNKWDRIAFAFGAVDYQSAKNVGIAFKGHCRADGFRPLALATEQGAIKRKHHWTR